MAEQKRTPRSNSKAKVQPVTDYGRIQPQAPELEEAVLGALMIEKDAYSLVSEILRPESFYEHRHQLIYSAITDLAVNQKPVDILTVKEQLAKRGDLEEVGGPFYITQLSSKVASSAHIEYHARIIAQKALARELITFTSNVQSKAFDETLDVDDLMQEAEGRLFEISQQNMKKDYTQINPVIAEAYQLIQKAAARGNVQLHPHARHLQKPRCGISIRRQRAVERIVGMRGNEDARFRIDAAHQQRVIIGAALVLQLHHVADAQIGLVGLDTKRSLAAVACEKVVKILHAGPGCRARIRVKIIPAEYRREIHAAAARKQALRDKIGAVAAETGIVDEQGIARHCPLAGIGQRAVAVVSSFNKHKVAPSPRQYMK